MTAPERGAAESVLIAAYSGRALAAAALRAGYAPLVADLFADEDTDAIAEAVERVDGDLATGFSAEDLMACLGRFASSEGRATLGLVYGAGFEARPSLLAEIGRRWRILGNPPEVLARLKEPREFAAVLRRLGVPHPEIAELCPSHGRGWLRKTVGGAGGVHIVPAEHLSAGGTGEGDAYFQRRVEGRAVSALFVAAGEGARIIGFSEQWRSPSAAMPFRFGGAVRPADLTPQAESELGKAVQLVAREFGLVGLNSADYIVGDTGWWLLEINPRPGATLDIFDGPAAPLFALHLAAVLTGSLPRVQSLNGAAAAQIVYAPRPLNVAPLSFPDWTADRPRPGTALSANAPFCTVLARGETAREAKATCAQRARYWHKILQGQETCRGAT